MSFQATVYYVMIASPSGVCEERERIVTLLMDWNREYSESLGVVLLPLKWEDDAAPYMGRHPQTTINKQMCDKSDLLIALFKTKLGTPTEQFESGTVEEIEYHRNSNKNVLLYFYEGNIPNNIDLEELKRLKEYKEKIWDEKRTLTGSYKNVDELLKSLSKDLRITFKQEILPPSSNAIEKQMEKYMEDHTISVEEINALFDKKIDKIPSVSIKSVPNSAGGETLFIEEVVPAYSDESFSGTFEFDYSNNNGIFTIGYGEHRFETKWSKASDKSIYAYSDAKGIDAIARIKSVNDIDRKPNGQYDFSSRYRNVQIGDAILWKNECGNYAITLIEEIQDDTRGADCDKLKCKYKIY